MLLVYFELTSKEILNLNLGFLKNHLESKFTDGMTWDNYGLKGWHIDHIKPCAAFDLNDEKEQQKCFHYANLQPMWWYDNLHKNSYFDGQPIRRVKV